MGIRRVALLCALAFVFSGCRGREDLCREYTERLFCAPLTLEGEIFQQSGEILNTFGIRGVYRDGETEISLLSPEEHKGIVATVKTGETRVTFDGAELVIPGEKISVFLLFHDGLESLSENAFSSVGGESLSGEDCIVVCYEGSLKDTETSHRVWISRETGNIVRMDSYFDGGVQSFTVK